MWTSEHDDNRIVDWQKPVDNGLRILHYEVKFRFVAGCSETYKCESPIGTPTGAGASPTGTGVVLASDLCTPGLDLGCTITSYSHDHLFTNRGYQYW